MQPIFSSLIDNINYIKASNWALKTSRKFKKILLEEGEQGWNFTRHSSEKSLQVPMQNCNCTRTLRGRFPRAGSVSDSTCSEDTYLRGPGQKIIGFSFYGNPNSTKSKYRKYFQVKKIICTDLWKNTKNGGEEQNYRRYRKIFAIWYPKV